MVDTYLQSLLEAAAAGEPLASDPSRLAAALEAQRDAEREQAETLALFDSAPVGIVRVDSLGRCIEANATAEELVGYSSAELRELTLRELIHPDHLQEQLALHRELLAGERTSYEIDKRYVRRDGHELWAHTRTTLVAGGDGEEPTTIVVVQDISEQKLAERALHEGRERLARIAETQRDIAAAGTDLTSVMELIGERAMALTGADGAMVNLIEGDQLFIGAAVGITAPLLGKRRPIEGTVVQHALAAGDTILIEDTETDPRINRELQAQMGDLSLICVPLFQSGRAVAAINVLSTSEERLGEQDRQMLELVAVVLAAAISRAAEYEAKREQLEALARFEATFEGALTGMILTDLDGRISEANPAIQAMLGYGADELAGRLISDFLHPEDREAARSSYLEMFAQAADSTGLGHRFVRRDGEFLWANASVAVLDGAEGEKAFAIAMVQDVTLRKQAEDALRAQSDLNEYQALHDPLTGLANRRLLRDRIDRTLALARRTNSDAAVLVLDVDGFKEINDSLDHAAGDALLVELGKRLEGVLRDADTVARMGGDEFGILLPNPGDASDVLRTVGRVRTAIEEPVMVQGLPLVVEASIGIALYPEDGDDVDTLLQRADVAMYHAKESNADWAFARDTEARSDPGRLTLVGELRRALEHDELTLYYQPKALLADGEVNAVEALVRWNHPTRGLVLPEDFIPIAPADGHHQAADNVRARRGAARVPPVAGRGPATVRLRQPLHAQPPRRGVPGSAYRSCWIAGTSIPPCSRSRSPRRRSSPTPPAPSRSSRACRRWVYASRSTTSAPVTRPWPTSSDCRSRRSRSIAPSS